MDATRYLVTRGRPLNAVKPKPTNPGSAPRSVTVRRPGCNSSPVRGQNSTLRRERLERTHRDGGTLARQSLQAPERDHSLHQCHAAIQSAVFGGNLGRHLPSGRSTQHFDDAPGRTKDIENHPQGRRLADGDSELALRRRRFASHCDRVVRALRTSLQLTQNAFAARLGAANQAVIYQWESRRRRQSPVLWTPVAIRCW
jgi:DNA-binding XRE family transcriptional regulator